MERRTFINAAIFGTILPFSESLAGSAVVKEKGVVEPERNIPVSGVYDVIVCGSGPAGVAAGGLATAASGTRRTVDDLSA